MSGRCRNQHRDVASDIDEELTPVGLSDEDYMRPRGTDFSNPSASRRHHGSAGQKRPRNDEENIDPSLRDGTPISRPRKGYHIPSELLDMHNDTSKLICATAEVGEGNNQTMFPTAFGNTWFKKNYQSPWSTVRELHLRRDPDLVIPEKPDQDMIWKLRESLRHRRNWLTTKMNNTVVKVDPGYHLDPANKVAWAYRLLENRIYECEHGDPAKRFLGEFIVRGYMNAWYGRDGYGLLKVCASLYDTPTPFMVASISATIYHHLKVVAGLGDAHEYSPSSSKMEATTIHPMFQLIKADFMGQSDERQEIVFRKLKLRVERLRGQSLRISTLGETDMSRFADTLEGLESDYESDGMINNEPPAGTSKSRMSSEAGLPTPAMTDSQGGGSDPLLESSQLSDREDTPVPRLTRLHDTVVNSDLDRNSTQDASQRRSINDEPSGNRLSSLARLTRPVPLESADRPPCYEASVKSLSKSGWKAVALNISAKLGPLEGMQSLWIYGVYERRGTSGRAVLGGDTPLDKDSFKKVCAHARADPNNTNILRVWNLEPEG